MTKPTLHTALSYSGGGQTDKSAYQSPYSDYGYEYQVDEFNAMFGGYADLYLPIVPSQLLLALTGDAWLNAILNDEEYDYHDGTLSDVTNLGAESRLGVASALAARLSILSLGARYRASGQAWVNEIDYYDNQYSISDYMEKKESLTSEAQLDYGLLLDLSQSWQLDLGGYYGVSTSREKLVSYQVGETDIDVSDKDAFPQDIDYSTKITSHSKLIWQVSEAWRLGLFGQYSESQYKYEKENEQESYRTREYDFGEYQIGLGVAFELPGRVSVATEAVLMTDASFGKNYDQAGIVQEEEVRSSMWGKLILGAEYWLLDNTVALQTGLQIEQPFVGHSKYGKNSNDLTRKYDDYYYSAYSTSQSFGLTWQLTKQTSLQYAAQFYGYRLNPTSLLELTMQF